MNHKNKVVVITGASSGIGRASALEFAEKGARLALIARSEDGLRTLAGEIRSLGGEALEFPCDVTDAEKLDQVAANIARQMGSVDIWVNNAAVSIYGEVDKVPLVEMKRLMDVNFFGQVNGVRAALPYLERAQGHGQIIGVLSVLSEAATPLQSIYVASKHALYGFYKALREELMHRKSRVRVSTALVHSMATPLFDHAKTYMGYRPKPIAPTYRPELCAQEIVSLAERPRFAQVVGRYGKFAIFMFRHFPTVAHWYQSKTAYAGQRSREPKGISDPNNLFAPMPGSSTVYGSSRPMPVLSSMESYLVASKLALGIAAGAAIYYLSSTPRPKKGIM